MRLKEQSTIEKEEENNSYVEAIKKEIQGRAMFAEMLYRKQEEGIAKRIEKCKFNMQTNIAVFFVVMIMTLFLIFCGGSLLVWIIVIYLFIALLKTGKEMLVATFNYMIHTEKPIMLKYIRKQDICTLLEERRYCGGKQIELEKMMRCIKNLTTIEELNPYRDVEYVEKRADTDVTNSLYNWKIIVLGCVIAVIIAMVF